MKRRDLEKRIAEIAKDKATLPIYKEGGSHTKVTIGTAQATIPRHREIKEPLAKKILEELEEG